MDKLKERFENEELYLEQGESPFTRKMPKDLSPWEQKYDVTPKFTGTVCQ